jgi:hypothetical protein
VECSGVRSSMVRCAMGKPRTSEGSEKCCTSCGEVKPVSEFYYHKQNQRHRPDCKVCVKDRSQKRYEDNPVAKLVTNKAWREAHPAEMRGYVAAWRARDPEHVNELSREGIQRIRGKVFDYYGRKCACCGSTEKLSIDHVYGGGSLHRQEQFGHTNNTQAVLRWLVANDFPAGFQTLCYRCNPSKGSGERCRLDHSVEGDAECRI